MDNEIVRSSTVFYESFVASTKDLPADEFKEAWMTIFNYAFYDEEPGELSPLLTMFYRMAKPNIDRNIQNRENGTNGGRPKKPPVTDEKPKKKSVSDKKPPVMNQKTEHIYDEDVDVDEDVSVDADVVVDVESPAAATTDNTHSTQRPSPVSIIMAFDAKKYTLADGELKRFVKLNEDLGWKKPLDEAADLWIANAKKAKKPKGSFYNFDQHEKDMEEEERMLLLANMEG